MRLYKCSQQINQKFYIFQNATYFEQKLKYQCLHHGYDGEYNGKDNMVDAVTIKKSHKSLTHC